MPTSRQALCDIGGEETQRGAGAAAERQGFNRTIAYLLRTRGIDSEIVYAMSHATLRKLYGIDWREDHRVAEGCLSDKALSRYLKSHPEIREIVFCYDNDMDGKDANGQSRNYGQVQANQSAESFAKADEEFRLADAAVISSILKEARKFDDVPPFVYPCGRRSDRMELQEDEWER